MGKTDSNSEKKTGNFAVNKANSDPKNQIPATEVRI